MNFKLIKKHSQSEKLIAINTDFIKEISMDIKFSFGGLSDFEIERLKKELGEMFNQRVWQLDVGLDEAKLQYITLIIKNDGINICHRICDYIIRINYFSIKRCVYYTYFYK